MVKRKTKAEKMAKMRVEVAFYRTCSGIKIDIFDIEKVFDHGMKLVAEGMDDVELGYRLRDYVQSISINK